MLTIAILAVALSSNPLLRLPENELKPLPRLVEPDLGNPNPLFTSPRWFDLALEGALVGVSLYDVMSTRYCLAHNTCYEGDSFLGSMHPGARALYGGFAIAMGAHAAIAWLLPRPLRTIWQGAALLIETGNVVQNYKVQATFQAQF